MSVYIENVLSSWARVRAESMVALVSFKCNIVAPFTYQCWKFYWNWKKYTQSIGRTYTNEMLLLLPFVDDVFVWTFSGCSGDFCCLWIFYRRITDVFFATLLLYIRIDWGDAYIGHRKYTHIICIRFSISISDAVMSIWKWIENIIECWLQSLDWMMEIRIKNVLNQHVQRKIGSSAPVKNP